MSIAVRDAELVDPALVLRAQSGDAEAVTALAERVRPTAQRFATRFLGDPVRGEDVAQAALMKAFSRLGDVRAPAAFPAWLMRIVRNECLNELGRERHMQLPMSLLADEGTQLQAPAGGDDDPEEALLRTQLQELVRRVAMTLPEHHRQALIMRALEDRTYEEISQALDVPVSVARVWYFRARKRFRTAFVTMMVSRRGVPPLCQEMGEAIAEMIEGSLSLAEAPRVREHVGGCAVCQQTEDELRSTAFRAPSRAMLVGLGLLRLGWKLPRRLRGGASHASLTAAKVVVAAGGVAVLATAVPGATQPASGPQAGSLPASAVPSSQATATPDASPTGASIPVEERGESLPTPATGTTLPGLPALSGTGSISSLLGQVGGVVGSVGSGLAKVLPTPGTRPGPIISALEKLLEPSPAPSPSPAAAPKLP